MPKPGETVRGTCDSCNTEFDVTLEPKVKEFAGSDGNGQIPAQRVQFCPFCGAVESELSVEDE